MILLENVEQIPVMHSSSCVPSLFSVLMKYLCYDRHRSGLLQQISKIANYITQMEYSRDTEELPITAVPLI